ncbi:MAG: DNA gyrase subunit A [Holosporales bacterium]|jgi:DNA gyrase subunit A|nr:DNA gyrase subunit A [Holosporales bacterium]
MMKSNRDGIIVVPIEEEVQNSYLDYAMSVIVSRALPDVRDGLKPVHRRIIHAMNETGNHHNKPYRKSARVVGEVMGKYHPHGDAAIYDTMVRLAQDFSLRAPLVDGQGNFGSMDGDSAAAPRYTEARMSQLAHELVTDIDSDTVDFRPNYDNTITEPSVLPAKFPNLLVNGTGGIAVGMATYIPTHNLGEVIDACCAVIDNSEITADELMRSYIPGPDFPTGGIIMGSGGVRDAFNTGRGSVMVRAKTSVVKSEGSKETILIHEIPYQVNKAKLVEKIAELVKEKVIEGISDIRDESNKDGVRIVIELKRDCVGEVILNQLFKHTQLQTSFGYNMLALVKNKPLKLSLREIIDNFIEFRQKVIIRRSKFNLKKCREKAHLLLGFGIAIANIDRVIEIIRSAMDRSEAKDNLMIEIFDAENVKSMLELVDSFTENAKAYKLTAEQADAILDLKLHKLTGLERDKIQNDLNEVIEQINDLLSILSSKQRVIDIIKTEMLEVKEKFSTPRLTKIEQNFEHVDDEDLIQREDMVVTYTLGGYIKRVSLSAYRAQKRGGRGKNGMETKEEDIVQEVIIANTHDEALFFSSFGKVYAMKVYRLPIGSPISKGRAIINMLPVEEKESISTILIVRKDENLAGKTLMFTTSFGNVRRNKFEDFVNIQSNGKRAILLDDGEKLIGVQLCEEGNDIFLSTRNGICSRFSSSAVRIFSGRSSNGVRGIKLKKGDEVISMAILDKWEIDNLNEREEYLKNSEKLREFVKKEIVETNSLIEDRMTTLARNERFILTVTEKGFGKISSFYEYRSTNRGTQGFTNLAVTERNGKVVASFPVNFETHIMMITNTGRIMRCSVEEVRITRRVSQGVILFRLGEGELIASASVIDENQDADEEQELSS